MKAGMLFIWETELTSSNKIQVVWLAGNILPDGSPTSKASVVLKFTLGCVV